jgi:hypothetical protein
MVPPTARPQPPKAVVTMAVHPPTEPVVPKLISSNVKPIVVPCASHDAALALWNRKIQVLIDYTTGTGREVTIPGLFEVCEYLSHLTETEFHVNRDFLGPRPIESLKEDISAWQHWFELHKDQLCYDEKNGRIFVVSVEGTCNEAALAVWDRKLQVLIGYTNKDRQEMSTKEVRRVCEYFSRITGIEWRFDGNYAGAMPSRYMEDDMNLWRAWFELHKNHLCYDDRSGDIFVTATEGPARE